MGKCFVKSKKVFFVLLLFLSAMFFSEGNVFAVEGPGAYPNGAEDFMAGAIPPPGYYFINYLTYWSANELKDGNGDAVPNTDLNVTADVLRFIYITKQKVFGGFWGVQMFLQFVNVDIETPGGSDNKFGLGDVIIDPFILSWHSKNWHFATGLDIYVPVGSYDEKDFANPGNNYWTFEPIAAFTYLSDSGFEVSSKFMYDFNTNNPDTDYLSGQEFHFDYTLGYKINNWRVGLGGYYYKQVTNDEQNGQKVHDDGNKGQAIAFGPQVQYQYKNMFFTAKYQTEVEVENRFDMNKFWFKFLYAF